MVILSLFWRSLRCFLKEHQQGVYRTPCWIQLFISQRSYLMSIHTNVSFLFFSSEQKPKHFLNERKKKKQRVLFCRVLLSAWTALMHLILPNVTDSQRMGPERWFWNVLILIEISIVVVDSLWIRSRESAAVLWHWSETIETVKSSFILCWTSCPLILVIGIHLPQILLCFLVKQLQFFLIISSPLSETKIINLLSY